MIIFHGFIRDAKQLCSIKNKDSTHKPLVEYYIHGHGYGHYSRSIAIIEVLNNEGYDVRMFISRSKMWEEIHFHHFGTTNDFNLWNASKSTYLDEKLFHIWIENGILKNDTVFFPNSDPYRVYNRSNTDLAKRRKKGVTTAISVSSILPTFSLVSALSHITERILGEIIVK